MWTRPLALLVTLALFGSGCASLVTADFLSDSSRSARRLVSAPPSVGDSLDVRRLDGSAVRGPYLGGLPEQLRIRTEADTVAVPVGEVASVRGLGAPPRALLLAAAVALDVAVLSLLISPRLRVEL